MTQIDAATGIVDDSAANDTHIVAEHSLRIQSQVGVDDYVLGLCVLEEKIFLIGETKGIVGDNDDVEGRPGGAFVMKLDLDNFLQVLWKVQIEGPGVSASRCVAREGTVYVGGHIPAGVSLRQDSSSSGSSRTVDVLAAAIDQNSGDLRWARRVDSGHDDGLGSVMVQADGGMIVYANAYNVDEDKSKVYVLKIGLSDGRHDWMGYPPDHDQVDWPGRSTTGGGGNNTRTVVLAVVLPRLVVLTLTLCLKNAGRNNSRKEETGEQRPGEEADAGDYEGRRPQGELL